MPQAVTPTASVRSPVEFIRLEVQEYMDRWARIRSAVDGEDAVKKLRTLVLPMPNPTDQSDENRRRYDGYIQRAVWYNATNWTLTGMVGFVFLKDPVIKLPAELAAMEDNVDGAGVTLNQQAKEALRFVIAYGRGGLLVDYPATENPTTKADLLNGDISPTICLYEPEQIINWQTEYIGAQMVITLLVLREVQAQVAEDDEFALVTQIRYRVFNRTADGVYARVFSQNENETFEADPEDDYIPTDSNGVPLKDIPFVFIGAVNNSPKIDAPPLLDLANLNLAHFRNSADYEESAFLVGQPTPWVAGLTQQWVTDVMKGSMQLGSRGIVPLPVGGQAGLLQADPNSMPMEAMKHKEDQMVALGAKLIQDANVERTATEVTLDKASEISVLKSAAMNVFEAYEKAFGFAGQYVGVKNLDIEYDLSEPLTTSVLDAQQAMGLMSLWQGGLLDFEEARFTLKRAGMAWKEDNVVKNAIDNEGLPPVPGTGSGSLPTPTPTPVPKPLPVA